MNSIEYSAVGIQNSVHSIPSTPCWFGEVKLTELHRRYEESPDTETRTRYQMLLLSLQGQKSGRMLTWCCAEALGDNRKVYGFGLVDWRDGWFDDRVAPGRTADVFCEQVRTSVARSKEQGRVAVVITDNLKTHTLVGSLLVRNMLIEFQKQLYLVYTPAYDPDANRIEWLWRVSLRVVTHNHHRSTFELLLVDVQQHFQALAQTPAEVLRHIGSPFAPDKDHDALLSLTQAA